jgi:hypothetical protein
MDHYSGLSKLLYLFLKFTNFSRLRLYVIDRQEHIAILKCAVDRNNYDTNMARSEVYGGLYKINGLNLKKLFNYGPEHDPDLQDYKDFIARFKFENSFIVNLDFLRQNTIPCSVNAFHKYHKINHIGVISLWEDVADKKNFLGYIAVDKGEKEIALEDMKLLDDHIGLIAPSMVHIINHEEADIQQGILMKRSDELIQKMKLGNYDIERLVDFLFQMIFEICKGSDIVQIKQILSRDNKLGYRCKYLYARRNPLSIDITHEQDNDLKSLCGMVFPLSEQTDWVTISVYETKSSKFIPNMKEYIASISKAGNDKVKECREFIRKRNNSEINIPFRINEEISGIIDVHGRRPYSLNENALHVLRDIALWFSILLSEKERCKHESCSNMSSLSAAIMKLSTLSVSDLNKKKIEDNAPVINYFDIKDVLININTEITQQNIQNKYYDNRNQTSINNYFKNSIIYTDTAAKYRNTKKFTTYGLALSLIALPFSFITNIVFMIPIVPIAGVISSVCFYKMASKGLKEYDAAFNKKNDAKQDELPTYLGDFPSPKEFIRG